MMSAMKSITHTITGLTSSLLLNVGLTQVAAKLDPIAQHQTEAQNRDAKAIGCAASIPCHFTPRGK